MFDIYIVLSSGIAHPQEDRTKYLFGNYWTNTITDLAEAMPFCWVKNEPIGKSLKSGCLSWRDYTIRRRVDRP